MERKENESREYYTIDLAHIVKSIGRHLWIVILSGLLAAFIAFAYSAWVIPPTYSSSIMLYVNNSSISLGNTNFSITASEITAAQGLVNTYAEILKTRTTLERVIDKAGVPYTYGQLVSKISATSANETEIMKVTVTTEDPYEASKIANCIAEVLPVRISEIIDGASMEVVDSAVPNMSKVAPNITTYTAVGLILGVVVSLVGIVIFAMLDDTIHDEEYVLRTYDYPILAKVPDLVNSGGKRYGYYYRYSYKSRSNTDKGDDASSRQ